LLTYSQSQLDIEEIAILFRNGSTVCYPTETLYGLGCSANSRAGIEKIYDIKKRDNEKNFTLLFKDIQMINNHCILKNQETELIQEFSPGPFAILLDIKETSAIDNKIVSPSGEICCRISSHPFVKLLFNYIDFPIVSTSANLSGNKNIFLFKTIYNNFHNLVDCIIDYGDIAESLGSSIIKNTENAAIIIREGDLSSKRIEDFYNGKS
tara:strand:+ start:3581 stop:4207 length:627 start_codon:yes stop_codon:yes gene_type:complete